MPIYRPDPVPGDWGSLDTSPVSSAELEERARKLLGQLSPAEKLAQMSGDGPLWRLLLHSLRSYNAVPYAAGENHRLGIPGLRFSDGPRGVVVGHSTCFPVAMARGASWDVALEERIGDAIGVEARAQGANFFGGVCINLLRHPAWGRAQETYGEDPHHVGALGAALVRGVQRHAMACVKHFAANSMEDARFRVDVRMDERTLREVYLPHFERCVREGAAAVMSAYNKLNGHFCGHNEPLLRGILKRDWGFQGLVMSDFVFGARSAGAAARGMDVEMPGAWRFGRDLERRVARGEIPEAVIDEAVLRILRQKLRFASVGEPERYRPEAVASPAHRALAREAAQKSMVLLQNRPVLHAGRPLLPLDRSALGRIAVIGRLAASANLGDRGSSAVRPPSVVTPLAGIRAAARGLDVVYQRGWRLAAAAAAARRADVAVVVVGYTHRDEGENLIFRGGDRRRLTLRPRDERLVRAVAAANPRTVVVLVTGSAIVTEAWRREVPALLVAWYPGMEGGHALADLLFGAVAPSGKLPCSFPRSAEQLPHFERRARSAEYGLWHGYRLLDRSGQEPAFHFGFGLSYTRFACRNLRLASAEIDPHAELAVELDVTNLGDRPGDEVVQLYAGLSGSRFERSPKQLVDFARVSLRPRETRRVRLAAPARSLSAWDEERGAWVLEPCRGAVWAGSSSSARDLLAAHFQIAGSSEAIFPVRS